MFKRSRSIHVNASPEALFEYVADFKRHPEWAHERLEIEAGDGPARGAGASYKVVVHFFGGVPTEIRVLDEQPPARLVYECEDKASKYQWTFDVQPEDGGARLRHSFVRQKERPWLVPLQPLVWLLLGHRMVEGGLANIKAKVEAGAAAAVKPA